MVKEQLPGSTFASAIMISHLAFKFQNKSPETKRKSSRNLESIYYLEVWSLRSCIVGLYRQQDQIIQWWSRHTLVSREIDFMSVLEPLSITRSKIAYYFYSEREALIIITEFISKHPIVSFVFPLKDSFYEGRKEIWGF